MGEAVAVPLWSPRPTPERVWCTNSGEKATGVSDVAVIRADAPVADG